MKYLRFRTGESDRMGIVEDDGVKEITGSFYGGYEFTGSTFNINEIKILPPCNPRKIVAVGLNYLDHVKEFSNSELPKNPVLFIKLPHTIIGDGDTIKIPEFATRVDYEAELAVVIKKYCKDVEAEDAGQYILGATCLNDVTERDIQKSDGQWTRGKNFETFCPIGPYIVSDLNYNSLDIKLTLNGKIKQQSNTSLLNWNVEELVSFISKVIPLYPGDIVTTGTPSGVGPMKDGDVVEVVIEGIGKLKNYVRG